MSVNRQSKTSLITWLLVDAVFIVIVVITFIAFTSLSRKTAVEKTREMLIWQVSNWADNLDSLTVASEAYEKALSGVLQSAGDAKIPGYLAPVAEDTLFSHVLFIKDGAAFDERGPVHADVSDYIGADKDGIFASVAPEGEYADADSYFITRKVGDSSYLVFLSPLRKISEQFNSFSYSEFMFMALTREDGTILGVFERYSDTDSVFITSPNMLSVISGGAEVKDFTTYKLHIGNGSEGAVASAVGNDSRTIVSVPIKGTDTILTLGLRQFYMDRLVKVEFAETKSAIIRLSVVLILFSIFTFGTLVTSSIKHKEHGKELEDKADTDLLTDLYNKLATERKIQEYIDENPDSKAMFFIFDVDNFKKINDTMGHAFGDLMLKAIGTQVRSVFRVTDIIGRVGGDEFIIFLKDIKDTEVKERADRLIAFFHDFKAGGDYVKYSATASIGAAVYPEDGKSFKGLYEAADQALYKAKKRGKNQLVFYNEQGYGEDTKQEKQG